MFQRLFELTRVILSALLHRAVIDAAQLDIRLIEIPVHELMLAMVVVLEGCGALLKFPHLFSGEKS